MFRVVIIYTRERKKKRKSERGKKEGEMKEGNYLTTQEMVS